ncbi:MAG: hypothetical protein KDC94_00105, partial [Aequorivita sp.]|nr:hypothetical protein [Aequorivita sp.]
RVYASDIKKMVQWYNLLVKNGLTDFSEPKEETAEDEKEVKATKTNSSRVVSPKAAAPKTSTPKASSAKKGGATKSAASRKT